MAARFWRGTGTGNWGSTGNWSATSGGATGASVPGVADDVTFDASGNNNCTIDTSARSCLSLTITSGYTSTITHTQQLTVAGNITLGANYTIAGTGLLIVSASSTIVTNGKTWPNNLQINTGTTITINTSNLIVSGSLILAGTVTFAGTNVWNCNTLSHTGVSAFTVTLKESLEYVVTNSFSCFNSRTGSILLFTSAHASTKALLKLNSGATCKCLANFTRIDSSSGRVIRSFNGTITDCVNIVSITDLKTVAG